MKTKLGLPLTVAFAIAGAVPVCAQAPRADLARWEAQAKGITIVRDDWGIAHVHGKTDADAVFGMVYAQAEDDFNRVETNFINSQGRLAEADECVGTYLFLASEMLSPYIIGQVIEVNGGQLMP